MLTGTDSEEFNFRTNSEAFQILGDATQFFNVFFICCNAIYNRYFSFSCALRNTKGLTKYTLRLYYTYMLFLQH